MRADTPFRTTVTVGGMTCQHCAMSVTEELTEVPGVRSVDVDVPSGAVSVVSDRELATDEIRAAVVEAGFRLEG